MNKTPEQIARDNIDAMLARAGWVVVDKTAINWGLFENQGKNPMAAVLHGTQRTKKEDNMPDEAKIKDQSDVDRGLIAMFIRMSPEERLRANDNAFRTIVELRDAYRRQKVNECKPK